MVVATQAVIEGHNNSNTYYTYLQAIQNNERI